MLSDLIYKALGDTIRVWTGSWADKELALYKQSLYSIAATRFSNEDVAPLLQIAEMRYNAWINALNYFTHNRLYAMKHTL
jgi:hypothetical protein